MGSLEEGDIFKSGMTDENRVIVLEEGKNGYWRCQKFTKHSSDEVTYKEDELYNMRFICNMRDINDSYNR